MKLATERPASIGTRVRDAFCALAGSACAAMLLASCTGSPRPPGTVVFASGADLESGNPLVTVHPLSRQVQRFALFTTLARYDTAFAPVPYAALAWDWSSDRRQLAFRLTRTLRWHDGRPTTSRDVAFTLMAARDPATGYPRAGDLAALDTVETPSDSVVVLKFRTPQTSFPLVLCELPILPEHLLASVPRSEMRRAEFNLAPVGNGPFRFVERVSGQRWRFEGNERFPVELGGPPRIEQFVVAVVDEPTTKFAGLASGDLDFAGIAPTMAHLASRDPTLQVIEYPVLFATALVLNVHRAPFDDVRVRRAFDVAINRERIVEAALAGYGRPAVGPVAPESPFALAREVVRDGALADSLFDAAGWQRNADGTRTKDGQALVVELLTVGSGDHAIEQLVQADLADRGVRVDIREMELGAFLTQVRAEPKAFDLLLTGIPGDVSLAYLAAMYDSRQRGGALDYADFHTTRLDALFAATRRARTTSELIDAWHDVQRELAREMPAVWIYHARGVQGAARRVQGVQMDLRGELVSLARWWVPGTRP